MSDVKIHQRIYDIIANYSTYQSPLTGGQICRKLDEYFDIRLSETELRQCFAELVDQIQAWRIPPEAKLIMSCSRGFCIAETETQYEEGINWIKCRMEPLHDRITQMQHIRRAAFGDQLKLNL
jgi:hypothetical protein